MAKQANGSGKTSSSSTSTSAQAAKAEARQPSSMSSSAALASIVPVEGGTGQQSGSDQAATTGVVPEPQAEIDVKSLLQEANAMLKKLGSLSAMRVPMWEPQGQIDVAMRSLWTEELWNGSSG